MANRDLAAAVRTLTAVRAVQSCAEAHPRPPHATQKDAAAMLQRVFQIKQTVEQAVRG